MNPKAACVIGWPVEHSRSPLIHGYWIRQLGLDAAYRREPVPPEGFADFVAHLADRTVVLGAGGAARAVVFGLIERGVRCVHVVNRSPDRAALLRRRFGDRVVPSGWHHR